ncbi:SpoIIIAH-like family protein [Neobacillus piezotolerans]|uniref:SpoIIIAH-like family protein n=1 Tax=Neobacillus piezotolerans TaxID=2259171 RepID=A0A3D8GM80_9BACI|nr:SpoIIIAH-like family protein [Neobacillus piezotolerans]RDU35166.1 SpoIIIAH-like family protein [Neobacillus piezotolerans]
MLLKKQTVWLLTMLSLVIVLSVYYITSEPQGEDNFAAAGEKAKDGKSEKKQAATAETDGKTVITEASADEGFATMRLKLTDQRNEMKEELEALVGTTNLPESKRSEYLDKIDELKEIGYKEEILETLLKSTMGYEDALVMADGGNVRVTVKSKNGHSAQAANEIIQLVRNEIGSMAVTAVEFKPAK